jgi:hypothetical protein
VTTALIAVEAVVIALLTIVVAGLLRSHAEILKRLHGLGAGLDDTVPVTLRSVADLPKTGDGFGAAFDVDGMGLRDDVVHVSVVGTRHQTLLAFLSSGCLTCQSFWTAFADRTALDLPDDLRIVIVAKDAAEESLSALRALAPAHVSVVLSSAAWAAYAVPGSPYFVLVDGAVGRVRGEGTGARWDQVWNLLSQAAADSNEHRIDRELLSNGVAPGDASLYRNAEEIARISSP